ncbi:MAG TPA: alpha/beta hydrolase [Bdellovibrionales bacterium]|nr:alpha/beta hydrolase [Bdellovibrionales bacterium]
MKRLVLLGFSLLGLAAQATDLDRGFVTLDSGRKLFVEHRPAAGGMPTLVLVNGLTWSTRQWIPFASAITAAMPGLGLVLYDMEGMGLTLLEKAPQRQDIPIENQAEDLEELMRRLRIQGPLSVAGLSYGGAVALEHAARYPRRFANVIAIAPVMERLPDQNKMIQRWIDAHRVWFPLDLRTDDELYDRYLRVLIYSTYPLAEPILLENPYKLEAVYLMVKGAKNWTAFERIKKFPRAKIHLIGAIDDEFVKDDRMRVLWEKLPPGVGESYLRVEQTRHKVPEERPAFTASWVREILLGNAELKKGLTFLGDPFQGEARSGNVTIPLNKGSFCEDLLRRAAGSY